MFLIHPSRQLHGPNSHPLNMKTFKHNATGSPWSLDRQTRRGSLVVSRPPAVATALRPPALRPPAAGIRFLICVCSTHARGHY